MSTTDHRAEAEQHLATAARHLTEHPGNRRIAEIAAWIGQGYATLARNEEQAVTHADMRDALTLLRRREHAMRELVSTHIAKALACKERNRWKAARDLAQALDEADANMDREIDSRLSDDGWDPKTAWNGPTATALADDPWSPKPDITADVPEPVRRVLVGQLAEMLLDSDNDAVKKWARGIAFELKYQGADLTDAIKTRIHDMTLGQDPTDPPF